MALVAKAIVPALRGWSLIRTTQVRAKCSRVSIRFPRVEKVRALKGKNVLRIWKTAFAGLLLPATQSAVPEKLAQRVYVRVRVARSVVPTLMPVPVNVGMVRLRMQMGTVFHVEGSVNPPVAVLFLQFSAVVRVSSTVMM